MSDARQGDEQELAHLVSLWQQGHSEGRPPEPTALCRDRPDLLSRLQSRIAALQLLDKLNAATGPAAVSAQAPSGGTVEVPAAGQGQPRPPAAQAMHKTLKQTPYPARDKARGGPGLVPIVGNYRLLSRLGEGALGEVWKAEALGGVEVAVKRLLRTLSSQEAQAELRALEHVKRLRHPHLAQIHAFWVHKNRLHLAMELADGSLPDRAAQCRAQGLPGIPLDELLRYVGEAAAALDYLHSQGIHHRDIKPANILLLKGCVKVADFGLARPLTGGDSQVPATFCGTPAFMAPEVWENKLSAHSDQWSLALTYAELRLHRPVFKRGSITALMTQVRSGDIDLAPLGGAEQQVLRRALHQDPHQRYPSCAAFAQALQAVLRPPPAPRRRWVTLLLLASLLACGLLALYSLRPPPPAVSLQEPPPLRLHTGAEAATEVRLLHCRGGEPVELVADAAPQGVEVEAGPAQGDSIPVRVRAGAQTRPGRYRVHLHLAHHPHAATDLSLTVLYVPEGFEPVGEDMERDGEVDYYRTLRKPLGRGEAVELVLVPQEKAHADVPAGAGDLPAYYIGRDKVTRGQFDVFVRQRPRALFPPKERKDPFADRWKAHAGDDPRLPARDLTVEEAHAFARWLGGPHCRHCRLPSVKEWNKAAGLYHSRRGQPPYLEGPYRGRWQDRPVPSRVAVGLKGPLRVGEASDDESVYRCRDMAGNGLEWTRDVRGDKQVPLEIVWGEALREVVSLRGCSFRAEGPLTFDRMDEFIPEYYQGHRPYIGFRVVLEPPGR